MDSTTRTITTYREVCVPVPAALAGPLPVNGMTPVDLNRALEDLTDAATANKAAAAMVNEVIVSDWCSCLASDEATVELVGLAAHYADDATDYDSEISDLIGHAWAYKSSDLNVLASPLSWNPATVHTLARQMLDALPADKRTRAACRAVVTAAIGIA